MAGHEACPGDLHPTPASAVHGLQKVIILLTYVGTSYGTRCPLRRFVQVSQWRTMTMTACRVSKCLWESDLGIILPDISRCEVCARAPCFLVFT